MRVRMWIPLPGPFAITSGRSRPRSTATTGTRRRGLFYWPSLPVQPTVWTAWFWLLVMFGAILWNVGVLITLAVVVPVQAVRARLAARHVEPTQPDRDMADVT